MPKFDKVKYDNERKKLNYDEMRFLVPKGKNTIIKNYAKENGMSVSSLVVNALQKQYSLDLTKKE